MNITDSLNNMKIDNGNQNTVNSNNPFSRNIIESNASNVNHFSQININNYNNESKKNIYFSEC